MDSYLDGMIGDTRLHFRESGTCVFLFVENSVVNWDLDGNYYVVVSYVTGVFV